MEFLSGFNFVISYTLSKENQKADSLTQGLNDLLSDDNNDCQQHLLQPILLAKKLEIISIEGKDNTIIDRMVQANLEYSYCSKLRHLLKADYLIKKLTFVIFLIFQLTRKIISVDLVNFGFRKACTFE